MITENAALLKSTLQEIITHANKCHARIERFQTLDGDLGALDPAIIESVKGEMEKGMPIAELNAAVTRAKVIKDATTEVVFVDDMLMDAAQYRAAFNEALSKAGLGGDQPVA